MEAKEKEIWREVPNYEGYYEVSNMGRVRSLDRTVITSRGSRTYKGRVIEGSVHKGYRKISLNVNGELKVFNTSQLVAMVFLGHKPDGHKNVVDHKNGDRSDDRVENLRVVSNRENLSNVCFRKDREILSSKYVGVSWGKSNSKWRADIQYEGEVVYLGCYDDELEASEVYQKALSEINNGVFNPDEYKPVYTSSHKGIYFHKTNKKWVSRVYINGKQKYLGLYPTELEAHCAVQKFKQNLSQKNQKKQPLSI